MRNVTKWMSGETELALCYRWEVTGSIADVVFYFLMWFPLELGFRVEIEMSFQVHLLNLNLNDHIPCRHLFSPLNHGINVSLFTSLA